MTSQTAAGTAAAQQQEIWTYSGTRSSTGARLNPVHVSLGTPTPHQGCRRLDW